MTTATRRATRRPTLKDVAALAGVSMKTVSRVVNGEAGVVPDKVAAVQLAVQQLDYRPNITASSLRRLDGRTAAVAALLEDLANPFSAELHRALEDAAHEHGVLIFAGSVDEDPARERQLVRAFTSRRADALVLAPASNDQGYLATEIPDGTPVVFVDRAPVGFAADAVVTDNLEGAERAVQHLLAHGHRRIGFLGDLAAIKTAEHRFEGYRRALGGAGLPLSHELVVHDLDSADKAAAALPSLLALPDPPTALFTAQNDVTVGVLRYLQAQRLERTIALVGFDDFPLADLLQPAVTVVAQDPTAIGRAAADLLFARLNGDDSPFRTVVVPSRLVVRGSGELVPPRP